MKKIVKCLNKVNSQLRVDDRYEVVKDRMKDDVYQYKLKGLKGWHDACWFVETIKDSEPFGKSIYIREDFDPFIFAIQSAYPQPNTNKNPIPTPDVEIDGKKVRVVKFVYLWETADDEDPTVMGVDIWGYYDGEDKLRHWMADYSQRMFVEEGVKE